MTDQEAREAADAAQNKGYKRTQQDYADLEFASIEDFDDMSDELRVVSIKGKSGKTHNFLVRSLNAAESALALETLFPKTVFQLSSDMGTMSDTERERYIAENTDLERLQERKLVVAQMGIVVPEGLTVNDLKKLSSDNLDKICEVIEQDITANDIEGRFPEDDAQSENGTEQKVSE